MWDTSQYTSQRSRAPVTVAPSLGGAPLQPVVTGPCPRAHWHLVFSLELLEFSLRVFVHRAPSAWRALSLPTSSKSFRPPALSSHSP